MREDEVAPTAVKVWNVGFIGSPDVGSKSYQETLPYVTDFLRDIQLKMGAPDEALGRRYQREIICRGTLEIISPLSGRRTTAAESFLVGGKNFFRFREPDDFFVAASRVTLGYPLLALFFPGGNLLVKWHVEKDKRGIQPKDVADLAAVVAGKEKRETHEKRQERVEEVAAVMGHKNFAHHLWNELPALERLIEDLPAERSPHLLLGREPLGR